MITPNGKLSHYKCKKEKVPLLLRRLAFFIEVVRSKRVIDMNKLDDSFLILTTSMGVKRYT